MTAAALDSAGLWISADNGSRFPRMSAGGATSIYQNILEASLGILPVMDNDANVGALGESLYGAGQGTSLFFT